MCKRAVYCPRNDALIHNFGKMNYCLSTKLLTHSLHLTVRFFFTVTSAKQQSSRRKEMLAIATSEMKESLSGVYLILGYIYTVSNHLVSARY